MNNYPVGIENDPNAPFNEKIIDLPKTCKWCKIDNPDWEYFDQEKNLIIVRCKNCGELIYI